jgi:hypothetical protein
LKGASSFGQDFATNTYSSSTEDFANPERGFYIQADSYASAPSPVPASPGQLPDQRKKFAGQYVHCQNLAPVASVLSR